MEFITNFVSSLSVISKPSKEAFLNLLSIKSFKKGAVIAEYGEVPTHFFVLKSGIVRSYITNDKGKEFIRSFFVPVTSTGSFSALILEKPSRLTYDCLTDCEIYTGDYKAFKDLTSKHIDLANMYSTVLERIFIRMEKRIFELSVLDATKRYLNLKKEIPNIDNLIPQYHIAAYLNITPVQLSRIRKELYSRKSKSLT
ncbi:MAG: Crp/Fnr family transcriptional regulator [Flavobacteriaceae bacterium]